MGETLDRKLEAFASLGFSGVVFVAKDGLVILHKGYGLADRSERVPMTTRTPFPIGPMTRIFTAAAILRLQMEGKIDTKDPVAEYDPAFRDPGGNARTTVHDLLAGSGAGKGAAADPLPDLIEKVSGETFEECLSRMVFEPARMRTSGFEDHPPPGAAPIARGHSGPDAALRRLVRIPGFRAILPAIAERIRARAAALVPVPLPSAAALRLDEGMVTTSGDLFLWNLALTGDTFFSPEARTQIFNPIDNSASYGWRFSRTDRGTPRMAAGADPPGYEIGMWVYPSDNLFVAVLVNNDMGWREGVRATVESSVLGRSYAILYILGGLILLYLLIQGAMRRRVPYRKGRHPRIYP